ncbi:acetyltransferase [Chlorobaculum limnaeum]|uniref:Acetyltransferase n=1 Tax=Chlorobaculum limnaeum TaxID=274537 RepID=A0A1D8D6K9_CHLLM|nr:arylamine N-acetyltransferase [Chlorobaculum limnaeum]AOS84424.1 acetyltransferase [Chlorobaculum limnaeum]
MKAANFDLPSYLARIGFEGDPSPGFETLKRMMRCQLCSVPFENLDVQAGRVPSLAPEAMYAKIVERRRGGYCYEVNGLFAMALEALGIPYRLVAARPMTYAVRRPKTHVAIIAAVDGAEWLCDLGFGSFGIREPIDLRWLDRELRQDFDTFRLTMASERDYQLQSFIDGEWKRLYEFNLCPQEMVDFEPANWLNATHPDTIFTQGLIVVLQHPSGKLVLSGERFRNFSEGRVEEIVVRPEEVEELLRKRFLLDGGR